MITYITTEDRCAESCNGKVCIYCGLPIEPIETVDNSNNPTFWTGCTKCCRFNPGTIESIYNKAKELQKDYRNINIETLVNIVSVFYTDHLASLEVAVKEKDEQIADLTEYRDEWRRQWRLMEAAKSKAEERIRELKAELAEAREEFKKLVF